jgi:hypothetical protein
MFARPPRHRWSGRRIAEMAAVLATVALVSWIVFGDSSLGSRRYPIPFLAVPILLWPAFRLGARETMVATIVMCAIAIAGTLRGFGPFVSGSPNESLIFLQAFVGVGAVPCSLSRWKSRSAKASKRPCATLNAGLEERVLLRRKNSAACTIGSRSTAGRARRQLGVGHPGEHDLVVGRAVPHVPRPGCHSDLRELSRAAASG